MVIINGKKLYEVPGSCGTCPFLITGDTNSPLPVPQTDKGHCVQWDEWHHTWASPPRRCVKLFKQAFLLYNDSGIDLTIVAKQ